MVSSVRHTITGILLVLGFAVCIQAQTTTQKVATASISGKVTINGKPAAGVVVVVNNSREERTRVARRDRARTDQTGSYRIANLPAGTYQIATLSLALVPANQPDTVVVAEGEQVEDIDISLVPGGVITGKISDAQGEPLIGERVRIEPVHEQFGQLLNRLMMDRVYSGDYTTDDRGVYRAFGLPAGKYKVAVGRDLPGIGGSREYYKETFYPSVGDQAKATIIEVKEGSETTDVDIVVGRLHGTFKVNGQVVDGESGKPLANVTIGTVHTIERPDGSSSSSGGMGSEATNANGEFRLENLAPGKYTLYTAPSEGTDVPSTSVSIDVVDRDISNLIIRTSRGSTLSGVAVIDGNESLGAPDGLRVCAVTEGFERGFNTPISGPIAKDGAFTIRAVRSGPVRMWLCSFARDRGQLEIIRVERNAIPQPDTFNVKEGERVAGLRLVLKYTKLTGAIRGQVKVENGELPPVSQLIFTIWPLEENLEPKRSSSLSSPQLDPRGRFFIEGLPAGHYRLSVHVLQPGTRLSNSTIQRVTVADDTVTEVTLIIKPKPQDDGPH